MTLITNIWLWIAPVLRLWMLLVATTLAPFATFAYDGHAQTNLGYDSNRESAIGYDAVVQHTDDETKNGTTGNRVLFAKFAGFVAAKEGQQIFRVVNDVELKAIQNSGKFEFLPTGSTPTGQPGKFFWSGADEAAQFQQYWYRGGENSHVISTTIGAQVKPTLFPNTDGIGTAIWVDLKDLTAPIILPK